MGWARLVSQNRREAAFLLDLTFLSWLGWVLALQNSASCVELEQRKGEFAVWGFAGGVPRNGDGIGLHFHGIGKAQGKSYSPPEAWEESCGT